MKYLKTAVVLGLLVASGTLSAGEVEVVRAVFRAQGNGTWTVDVTLRHGDTGWDHYADAWRVVSPDGQVFGTRTLYHPHVNEQPFTRSLSGVKVPADMETVMVEAHDSIHGWSMLKVRVNLRSERGERYRVMR